MFALPGSLEKNTCFSRHVALGLSLKTSSAPPPPQGQVGDVFVMMIASLDEGQILTAPLRFWEKLKVQTKLYVC